MDDTARLDDYDTCKKNYIAGGNTQKTKKRPEKLTVRDEKTSHSGGTHKLSPERSTGIVQREKVKGAPYTGSPIITKGFVFPGPCGN